jgi:anti-anti-sigma factor
VSGDLGQVEIDGDDVVIARISGEVDLSNAAAVGEQLAGAVPNTALGLVVDLTATAYLDSSGVHLVFDLADRLRQRQQQMRIVAPEGAPVRRILRIVEMGGTVPVLAAVDAAVADVRASV